MSEETNKNGIRRMIEELWNKGNMDIAPELYTEDYVLHSSTGVEVTGVENVVKQIALIRDALPDIHASLEDIIAEGDKVAYRMKITGTHKGELSGIPPTGKILTMTASLISRSVDGKEAEAWAVQDRLSMFQQMGVTPPPA